MSPFGRACLGLGLLLGAASGCGPGDDSGALVVATTWPPAVRARAEALYHGQAGVRAIHWLVLDADAWPLALDRRGGVDLVVGGSPRSLLPILDAGRLAPIEPGDACAWRVVDRPAEATDRRLEPQAATVAPLAQTQPTPVILDEAAGILDAKGWEPGWSTLIRRVAPATDGGGVSIPRPQSEVLALIRDGQHADLAQRFAAALAAAGWTRSASPEAPAASRAGDLRADLLDSALIAAQAERRDALDALARAGHPEEAEAALVQLPPWPPASVARLRADPARGDLIESLLAQVAPDPAARAWLRASWSGPRHSVDPALLAEIAHAGDGRLAREGRFRAWLRGEWTASMQQHYRRVARLAGGYHPQ